MINTHLENEKTFTTLPQHYYNGFIFKIENFYETNDVK
jgi:hypothetical protein